MRSYLRTSALAITAALGALVSAPQKADAYAIDCAILLCLAGGWPTSNECTAARIEFIRRVTPWPIEPPLQIWRCPMGASFKVDDADLTVPRIWEASASALQSLPTKPFYIHEQTLAPQPAVLEHHKGGTAMPLPDGFALQLAQDEFINEEGQADIDVSGREFDFIRTIRLYDVRYVRQRETGDGECNRSFYIRRGTYGPQGEFRWTNVDPYSLPPAHIGTERYGAGCVRMWGHRSVFVDWRDHVGNYGYEQINY